MDKQSRLLLIGYLLCVIALCIPTAVGLMAGIIVFQNQEAQEEKDLKRLFYILRAAEQRHAGYLAYDVPQADPFSRAQRVEYFTACGYVVVAEGREGHFIVKRIDSTEEGPTESKP